jgi:hypothetical protein
MERPLSGTEQYERQTIKRLIDTFLSDYTFFSAKGGGVERSSQWSSDSLLNADFSPQDKFRIIYHHNPQLPKGFASQVVGQFKQMGVTYTIQEILAFADDISCSQAYDDHFERILSYAKNPIRCSIALRAISSLKTRHQNPEIVELLELLESKITNKLEQSYIALKGNNGHEMILYFALGFFAMLTVILLFKGDYSNNEGYSPRQFPYTIDDIDKM